MEGLELEAEPGRTSHLDEGKWSAAPRACVLENHYKNINAVRTRSGQLNFCRGQGWAVGQRILGATCCLPGTEPAHAKAGRGVVTETAGGLSVAVKMGLCEADLGLFQLPVVVRGAWKVTRIPWTQAPPP